MSKETVLAELSAKIGKEDPPGPWTLIDQARINLFADATNDHQWIHVNPEKAKKESPYGTAIAHGFLTLSLLPYLTGSVTDKGPPYPGVKLGVNYGLNKVRFPAPVKAGSRIRTRGKLKEVTEVTGGLQFIREVTVDVEGEDKPCCVAETISRLYF